MEKLTKFSKSMKKFSRYFLIMLSIASNLISLIQSALHDKVKKIHKYAMIRKVSEIQHLIRDCMQRVLDKVDRPITDSQNIQVDAGFYPFRNYEADVNISNNQETVHTRKFTLDGLKESDYILKLISELAVEAIALLSSEYEILYLNKLMHKMFQQPSGKGPGIGDNILSYVHADWTAEFKDNLNKSILGEMLQTEMKHINEWYKISFAFMRGNDTFNIVIVVTIIDITSEKEKELIINTLNDKLSQISWQLSHELRSLEARILATINLIEVDNSKDNLERYLEIIRLSGIELDKAIREMSSKIANPKD